MTVDEMRRRWRDGWSAGEIAMRAGCQEWQVHALRRRHGWPDPDGSSLEPPPPSVEDARLSEDSLRLSPWVQARADEIRAQRLKELLEETPNATQQRNYRRARCRA